MPTSDSKASHGAATAPGSRSRRRVRFIAVAIGAFVVIGGAAYAFHLAAAPREHDHKVSGARFAIHSRPSSRTVVAGGAARFALLISRRRDATPLSDRRWPHRSRFHFRLVKPLPDGITSGLRQRRPGKHVHATLSLAIAAGTPDGIYQIPVRLIRAGRSRESARASITLIVDSAPPPTQPDTAFRIAGALQDPLEPGSSTPLDLTLSNPTADSLTISGLSVAVDTVDAPNANPIHPCTVDDFTVDQFSGAYGFPLPAGASMSLSGLGLSPVQWPQVGMVNSAYNQNGCKEATVNLAFSGTSSKESE